MFILYNDNNPEITFSGDYKPLPDLSGLNCTEISGLVSNLYNAIDNAFVNHAALLENALYDDIVTVNRKRCFDYLLTVSPGHLATVIGNTKYSEIDKAVSVSWQYFNCCDDDILFDIGTDPANIEKIIQEQYNKAKGEGENNK